MGAARETVVACTGSLGVIEAVAVVVVVVAVAVVVVVVVEALPLTLTAGQHGARAVSLAGRWTPWSTSRAALRDSLQVGLRRRPPCAPQPPQGPPAVQGQVSAAARAMTYQQ